MICKNLSTSRVLVWYHEWYLDIINAWNVDDII